MTSVSKDVYIKVFAHAVKNGVCPNSALKDIGLKAFKAGNTEVINAYIASGVVKDTWIPLFIEKSFNEKSPHNFYHAVGKFERPGRIVNISLKILKKALKSTDPQLIQFCLLRFRSEQYISTEVSSVIYSFFIKFSWKYRYCERTRKNAGAVIRLLVEYLEHVEYLDFSHYIKEIEIAYDGNLKLLLPALTSQSLLVSCLKQLDLSPYSYLCLLEDGHLQKPFIMQLI
jgi:hypothetical protein